MKSRIMHVRLRHLGWGAFYLFAFALLIYNSFSYLDPDFGWHLRSGEIVWQTQSVPRDQLYMWTLEGETWVDHEWLADLLTWGLWSGGGYIGVTVFFALVPVLTLWLLNRYVFRHYLRRPAERAAFALFELAALAGMLPHLGVRMQELTVLALLLLFIIIDRVRREGRWQPALWLVPLIYIWSCLHAGFLLGLAILFGWIGYEWLRRLIPRLAPYALDTVASGSVLARVSGLALVAFAATLATPYGLELYAFLSDYRETFYMSHIQEWRSPTSVPIRYWQLSFIAVALAAAIGARFFSREKLPLWNLGVLAVFGVLALKSVRHFPLFALVFLLLILPHALRAVLKNYTAPLSQAVKAAAVAGLFLSALAALISARITDRPFSNYCQQYPCAAAAFIAEHPEYSARRMFNDYNWGGYLIGIQTPAKLFIDGRLPQYPYNGRTLLEEYVDFFKPGQAGDKLDEHEIEIVLFRKNPSAPQLDWFEKYVLGYDQKNFSPNTVLVDYLRDAPEWERIYEDELSFIYLRR